MAKDVVIKDFSVQPVEEHGYLVALTIQPTVRVGRKSSDGKVLSYGMTENDGEPIKIPVSKLADLIRELADWPIYYASGEYALDNVR